MFARYEKALGIIGSRVYTIPGLQKTLEGCYDLETAVELLEDLVKKLGLQ